MFMKPKLTSLKTCLKNTVAKVRRNEDGLASIEFGLLAPLLITMYFGLAEIATAVAVDRSVSHATNVAGDLTSQVSNVDEADLEDLLTATLRIMQAPNSAKVTIQLDSWTRDAAGQNTSVGTATMNAGASPLQSFNIESIDTSLLNENAGIIVARVSYAYSPFKAMFFDSDITIADTFILKPRRSAEVIFGDSSGTSYSCSSSGTSVSCS